MSAPATGTTQPPEHVDNHGDVSLTGFNTQMVLLTWVAFSVAAFILSKLLWKPLLKFVENREAEIRDSLKDAEKARLAAREADAIAQSTISRAQSEAQAKAEEIAAAAQKQLAAREAEAQAELKAKREAAEANWAATREQAIQKLSQQAGEEIGHALETLLPGLLTEEQRQAYQNQIASAVKFH